MMSCQEAHPLLDAYVDAELDPIRSLEFENHLEHCAECRAQVHQLEHLRSTIRARTPYFAAPEALEKSIRAQLHVPDHTQPTPVWKRFPAWRLSAAAAGVIALAIFSALFITLLGRPSAADTLAEQVVSGHIRSLMANHLTDVPSTDRHTVKPWFNGKLDFSPPVKDLKAEGFPLTGGRLDYLNGRAVAALLYRRNQHPINLFVWPSSRADSPPQTFTMKGYNVIHWTQSGMDLWAVSDLNGGELSQFASNQRK